MNQTLLNEIRLSYHAHNLRPFRDSFFHHGKRLDYACPLTALALHRGVVSRADPGLELDQATNPAFEWACREFGREWVGGFIDGFDRRKQALDNQAYLDGHAFGASVARQFFPGGDQVEWEDQQGNRIEDGQYGLDLESSYFPLEMKQPE